MKYSNSKAPRTEPKSAVMQRDDYSYDQNSSQALQRIPMKKANTAQDQIKEKQERSPSPKNETVNVYSVKIPVDLASGEVIKAIYT